MSKTKLQYEKEFDECKELFSKKMKDYGSAWRILRLPSLTDQIFIKAERIRNLQESEDRKIQESEYSEFIGIVNYSVMAIVQIEKGTAEKPDIDTEEAILLYEKTYQKAFDLMELKNHDYGEVWRKMRISSITDLILQKLLRIKQIEDNKGKTIVSEGLEANYLDMINYAIFAMIKTTEKG